MTALSPSPNPAISTSRTQFQNNNASGLSRLAFAASATSLMQSSTSKSRSQSQSMARDSSSNGSRPCLTHNHSTLQSFLEGVEFATRCHASSSRRGESRAGSRQPSHAGPQREESQTRGRRLTLAEQEEAFLSDEDEEVDELQVFEAGDRLTVGKYHDGSLVVDVFPAHRSPSPNGSSTPAQLEIVRRLGSGSYAVVYLAREILNSRSPEDELDLDEEGPTEYGKEFALKCLCKKNLTEDLLEVQKFEATLHQSLPSHPNIVAMHGACETDKWLFLILEYCPGQDLFYWLEQARDHEQLDTLMHPSASFNTARAQQRRLADEFGPESHSATPPSPTLLSITAMSSLLSRRRLRLISRMFIQMCEAMDACHKVGISHRDIKPENFICCDEDSTSGLERRVTVKITDWGLGTAETECGDFDCGSKPYMSYECRNNLAPTYRPREADIWSLGIVLLNLLFHRCPWADPSMDDPDFSEYRKNPNHFLNDRFKGIGPEVSHFLATRVLNCHGPRVSAADFAIWAGGLVRMMSQDSATSLSPKNVNVSQAAVPLIATRAPIESAQKIQDILSQANSTHHSRRSSWLTHQLGQGLPINRLESPDLPQQLADSLNKIKVEDESGAVTPGQLASSERELEADEEPSGVPLEAGLGSNAALLAAKAKRRKRGARKSKSAARQNGADDDGNSLPPPHRRPVHEKPHQKPSPPHAPIVKPAKSSFFKNLRNGNPDLEAFIARAKEKEAMRDAASGGTYSAPARIQHLHSGGSVRSFGSNWSAEDEQASHWASTSNRRDRLASNKQMPDPVSPVTSSTSSASSPSSKHSDYRSDYSHSSYTSVSTNKSSRKSSLEGDVTPQAKNAPFLQPIDESASPLDARILPPSNTYRPPITKGLSAPPRPSSSSSTETAHPPLAEKKFSLKTLFR